ncbi:MAG: (2Fe-2S) ferredoxin domain-containing protein [Cyanobacteria bacterium P01_D01_bin.156]
MLAVKQLPPNMFVLDGKFLGYIGKTPNKVKAIILDVEQEALLIKLPKKLRASLKDYHFQPGEPIRCIGRSQVDFKTGNIKLRAYQVFRVTPSKEDTGSTAPPKGPISTIVASPRAAANIATSTKQKQAKIVVCRKSGCQKRGGRQLVAMLEKLLKVHQLSDQVDIQYTGCQKRCSKAPMLTIMPGKYRYDRLDLQSLPNLVEKHFCTPEPCSSTDK